QVDAEPSHDRGDLSAAKVLRAHDAVAASHEGEFVQDRARLPPLLAPRPRGRQPRARPFEDAFAPGSEPGRARKGRGGAARQGLPDEKRSDNEEDDGPETPAAEEHDMQ